MPKKTKKDKILAEKRAKNQAENLITDRFVKPQSNLDLQKQSGDTTSIEPKKNYTASLLQTSTLSDENKHLKTDLVKILVFSFFALITQGMIYYFLRG